MTWAAKDAMPQRKFGEEFAPPSSRKHPVSPEEGGVSLPPSLPTYAQRELYYSAEDEDLPWTWTQQQERELLAAGIFPEREWNRWQHAMTRGIVAE